MRWLVRLVALGVIAGVLAVSTSCREVLGIDDREVQTAAALRCADLPASSSACATCTDDACCLEEEDCATDPGCVELFRCLGSCTGDVASITACRIACGSDAAVTGEAAARLLACQGFACEADCGLVCGGFIYDSASCESCGLAHCCVPATACATSESCWTVSRCVAGCSPSDGPCRLACLQSSGAPAYSALDACKSDQCTTCGEPQWSCLGEVEWPGPTGAEISVALHVVDFGTTAPVSSALVRYCAETDPDCAAAGSPEPVDADGGASLTVPVLTRGFFEISGNDLVPTLYYPEGPMTVDRGLTAPVFTELDFGALDAQPNLAKAHVVAVAVGCASKLASGVTFATDGETPVRYWTGSDFELVPQTTGASGEAAMLDLEGDSVEVTAFISSSGATIDSRKVALRPGHVTWIGLGPRP